MRHNWYELAREASDREPGFVYCRMAQELANPAHAGKDRSALCATEGEAA